MTRRRKRRRIHDRRELFAGPECRPDDFTAIGERAGDSIGEGQTRDFSTANAVFTAGANESGIHLSVKDLAVDLGGTSTLKLLSVRHLCRDITREQSGRRMPVLAIRVSGCRVKAAARTR